MVPVVSTNMGLGFPDELLARSWLCFYTFILEMLIDEAIGRGVCMIPNEEAGVLVRLDHSV
jgi:hypothetical protein